MRPYLRASLLGAVDGVITSFVIVVSASALHSTSARTVVLVVGGASLFGDAFSMGASESLSSSSEQYSSSSETPGRGREGDAPSPWKLGLACFGSFLLAGSVPLALYAWTRAVVSTAVFSVVELMLLGALRTRASGEGLLKGVLQTSSVGGLAGLVAWLVALAVLRVEEG